MVDVKGRRLVDGVTSLVVAGVLSASPKVSPALLLKPTRCPFTGLLKEFPTLLVSRYTESSIKHSAATYAGDAKSACFLSSAQACAREVGRG